MSINLKRIETAQHFLERELVTNKLVSLVRREPPSGWVDAGRYHFLWKALKQDNQLLEALRLDQEWASSALGTTVLPTAVLPTSIRIEGLSGGRIGKKDLIPEGVALPAEGHFTFHVMENPGYIIIPLFQGDHVIKEIRADIDPNLPSGTTIDFHIMVYEQGFITCRGKIGDHEFVAALETPEMQVSLQVTNTDRFRWFENQWQEFAHTYAASDPAFLHGIALMHWEWALEFDEDDKDQDGKHALATYHYRRAKYYWVHLLGRQGYWQSFSEQYWQSFLYEKVPKDVSAKLHRQVSQELLHHHYNRCRTSFNNGDLDTAIFHLKCLYNWNLKDETCAGMYDEPLLEQEWDQAALETVNKEAEWIFNGWVGEWLAQANRALDDPDADLPCGISKNYQGALDVTRPYLELVPGNPRLFQRLLLFILRQANGWCYEAAIAEKHKNALDVIESVQPVVEHLESLLIKPASNALATAGNKTLSTTYWLKAQLVDGTELVAAYAKLAAEWDPGNRQAGRLSAQMNVRIRMDQAQKHLEAKEFQKAIEILAEIDLEAYLEAKEFQKVIEILAEIDLEAPPDAKESVHSLIAGTHFQWAMHCAELATQETEDLLKKGIIRGTEKMAQMRNAMRQLEEARDHMALALEYEPEHPVLTGNLEALEHKMAKALRLLAALAEAQGNIAQASQFLEWLGLVAPNDHRSALRGALLCWQRGEQEAAVAQLQKLLSIPRIAPLASFWLGRLFLIRAGESFNAENLQQAYDHLNMAARAGIPEALWYEWLCKAKMEYDPETGWSQRGARQLLKALPGSLSAVLEWYERQSVPLPTSQSFGGMSR